MGEILKLVYVVNVTHRFSFILPFSRVVFALSHDTIRTQICGNVAIHSVGNCDQRKCGITKIVMIVIDAASWQITLHFSTGSSLNIMIGIAVQKHVYFNTVDHSRNEL